jgi:hypothetical protein
MVVVLVVIMRTVMVTMAGIITVIMNAMSWDAIMDHDESSGNDWRAGKKGEKDRHSGKG